MSNIHVNLGEVILSVDFTHTSPESRNHGHPDDRLPDVASEIVIDDIDVINWDTNKITALIQDAIDNEEVFDD